MYKKDMLKEYINNSELRVFNSRIKVRLSKELATNCWALNRFTTMEKG